MHRDSCFALFSERGPRLAIRGWLGIPTRRRLEATTGGTADFRSRDNRDATAPLTDAPRQEDANAGFEASDPGKVRQAIESISADHYATPDAGPLMLKAVAKTLSGQGLPVSISLAKFVSAEFAGAYVVVRDDLLSVLPQFLDRHPILTPTRELYC